MEVRRSDEGCGETQIQGFFRSRHIIRSIFPAFLSSPLGRNRNSGFKLLGIDRHLILFEYPEIFFHGGAFFIRCIGRKGIEHAGQAVLAGLNLIPCAGGRDPGFRLHGSRESQGREYTRGR